MADQEKKTGHHSDKMERTLYVGDLDQRVTEELLYELMIQAGPVEKISIVRPDRHIYSYAFVLFEDEESVPYTIRLFQNVKLFERPLLLKAGENILQERRPKMVNATGGNFAKGPLQPLQYHQIPVHAPSASMISPTHAQVPMQLPPFIGQYGFPQVQPQQYMPPAAPPTVSGSNFNVFPSFKGPDRPAQFLPTSQVRQPMFLPSAHSSPFSMAPPVVPFSFPPLFNPAVFQRGPIVPVFNIPSHSGVQSMPNQSNPFAAIAASQSQHLHDVDLRHGQSNDGYPGQGTDHHRQAGGKTHRWRRSKR